ncbi:transposase [Nonomuraea sp. B12E4]|uniref:transposase n=1 Tax=Nonomuraea sp. B12E4 TaxID=3153564 RepID=UPI00325C8DD7
MLQALIDGRRDRKVLAGMARGSMRGKIPLLEEALRGFFTDHHAVLLRIMLANIDRLTEQASLLDAEIEQAMRPFAGQAAQLDEITGVGPVAAQELIAEIGVEMSRFPTAAHLVSWAKFCPQTHESAGRKKGKGRGKGNRWLAGTLGRIVFSVGKTDTFLGERYRRIARRRGKSKALVAAGNSVLTVVYQLLSDPEVHFCDLGADYYDTRINKDRRARSLAGQLQALTGQKIVIRNGKAASSNPRQPDHNPPPAALAYHRSGFAAACPRECRNFRVSHGWGDRRRGHPSSGASSVAQPGHGSHRPGPHTPSTKSRRNRRATARPATARHRLPGAHPDRRGDGRGRSGPGDRGRRPRPHPR